MANWRNRQTIMSIDGFDELMKEFQKAGRQAEVEGRKCFEKCGEIMYDELYSKATSAGLAPRLVEQIHERFIEDYGLWYYEVGWKKQRPSLKNPIPDTYKVLFYNYGTPSERRTKAGQSRGKENAHPEGSHGFIKKAKLASRNKIKKLQKDALKEILKGLE